MSVTNTITERTITGINESEDLFLDNSSSTVNNTGAIEREIEDSHDANFVHPLGDELVINGTFDTDSDWTKGDGSTISNGKGNIVGDGTTYVYLSQPSVFEVGKKYLITLDVVINSGGGLNLKYGIGFSDNIGNTMLTTGSYSFTYNASVNSEIQIGRAVGGVAFNSTIDNVSVKEVLVNRESDITNTGVTIRDVEGINESEDLFLDNSNSTVTNTGVTIRGIEGINESETMFPDNTSSDILNIGESILPLLRDLEDRAEYYENEESTIDLLASNRADLLNKASLIMTPTAYSSGELHSVKPVSFTSLEPTFYNQNGWSWDGSILLGSLVTGNTSFVNDIFLDNKNFIITFKVLTYVSGDLGYRFGGASVNFNYFDSELIEGNTIKLEVQSDATVNNFQFLTNSFNGSLSDITFTQLPAGDFDFTRGSSATRVNEQGLIEEVGSNIPRIDYSSGEGALLLEPSRTNVLPHSNNYDEWIKGSATVTSGQIGVGGSLDAWKLQKTDANGYVGRGGFSYDGVSTFSIFAKAGSVDWLRVTSQSGNFRFNVNLTNGEVGVTGSLVTSTSVEYYGNGWYRCTATGNSLANGFYIKPAETDDNPSGVDGFIFIQNSQVETNSSYATSYIPTNGSAVTRAAETCNGSGNADTFNDSEGVLMVETSALADDLTNRAITISDGTANNRLFITYYAESNGLFSQIISNGVVQATLVAKVTSITDSTKVLVKYKQNDFALWVNGFEVDSDESGVTPIGLDDLSFDRGTGTLNFYGKTKQIQYFDTTDIDLEQLTSWDSFRAMAEAQSYTIE